MGVMKFCGGEGLEELDWRLYSDYIGLANHVSVTSDLGSIGERDVTYSALNVRALIIIVLEAEDENKCGSM